MPGPPAPPPAIEMDHLSKQFGAFKAVDELTMSIGTGEIFCFLGSNGAGKSTAIRMLCGLLKPTSGTARVMGIDVAREPDRVKKVIGYMSQRFSLYDDLTVHENLRFFGGVYGLTGDALRARTAWALSMAALEGKENRITGTLPGGWKQRLALGCAVLHDPRVLFLDEPTGGVDPLSRRRFWDQIREMAARGVTVMVTTHYMDEAEQCDRLALIHAGRLVAIGSVAELKEVFAGRVVLEVRAPRYLEALEQFEKEDWVLEVRAPRYLEALEEFEKEDWVLEATVFGTRLHLVVADLDVGGRRALELLERTGNSPATVARAIPSLEDVFIHYIEAATGRGRSVTGAPA